MSRYYERVERPEQLIGAALEAMRVLTDPAQTGAVTLAMPEDVQTEAFDVPDEFLERRVWTIYRQPPALEAMVRAEELIRSAQRPLIVAGGGVIYSEATAALREFVDATGIPVCETQAGRGALVSDHQLSLGAVGATGTGAANRIAREADLVIGIGTRWSDFTTASKSAFQDAGVRFVNINVASFDAAKQSALPLVADARAALVALAELLHGWRVEPQWEMRATEEAEWWTGEVRRLVSLPPEPGSPPSQASIIGAINDAAGDRGVVVCAAGSAPGDLHKLWRARDPDGKSYQVEYGYSCMGYEIPGGIGVKLAAPDRDVFVLVGDGSYLMLPGELVTAVAERIPIVIVLVDNHGYASIGALSRSVGSHEFGTHLRDANDNELPIDLAGNAASLGAEVIRVSNIDQLRGALDSGSDVAYPVVIYVESDRYGGGPTPRAGGTCLSPRSPTRPTCARLARATSGTGARSGPTWRRPMSELLVHCAAAPEADGTLLEVTPESAGWRYVGFEVLALDTAPSPAATPATASCALVVVSGTATISSEHGEWRDLGGRADPWSGLPDAAYLPPATSVTIEGDGEVALCWAPAPGGGATPRLLPGRRDRRRDPRLRRARAHGPSDPDGRPRGRLAAGLRGDHASRPLVELSAAQARPRRSPGRDAAGGDVLPPDLALAGVRPAARVQRRPYAG